MSQQTSQPHTGTGEQEAEHTTYAAGAQQGRGAGTPGGGQQIQPGGQGTGAMGGQQQYQMGGQQQGVGSGTQQMTQPGGGQQVQPGGQFQSGVQQQPGMGGQGAARAFAQPFEDTLTSDMRLALHDFVQSATVCEWCADQCIPEGPQMAECIRLCRDVADLAAENVKFMARDSPFGPELAETFAIAAEECANECARHSQPHCQECASVLRRAVDSTWQLLESIEQQGAAGTQQQLQQY